MATIDVSNSKGLYDAYTNNFSGTLNIIDSFVLDNNFTPATGRPTTGKFTSSNALYYFGIYTGTVEGNNNTITISAGLCPFSELRGGTVRNLTIDANNRSPANQRGYLYYDSTNSAWGNLINVHIINAKPSRQAFEYNGSWGHNSNMSTVSGCSVSGSFTYSSFFGTMKNTYVTNSKVDITATGSSTNKGGFCDGVYGLVSFNGCYFRVVNNSSKRWGALCQVTYGNDYTVDVCNCIFQLNGDTPIIALQNNGGSAGTRDLYVRNSYAYGYRSCELFPTLQANANMTIEGFGDITDGATSAVYNASNFAAGATVTISGSVLISDASGGSGTYTATNITTDNTAISSGNLHTGWDTNYWETVSGDYPILTSFKSAPWDGTYDSYGDTPRFIPNSAPPVLSASDASQHFIKGSSVNYLTVANAGGDVDSYSISPSLSTGLTLSGAYVTGTPTTLDLSGTTYVVTGTNADGDSSASVVLYIDSQFSASLTESQRNNLPTVYDRVETDLSIDLNSANARTTRRNMIGLLLETNTDISAIRVKTVNTAINTMATAVDIYSTGSTINVSDRKVVNKNVAPMGQLINENDVVVFNHVGGSETLSVTRNGANQYVVSHNGTEIGTYEIGTKVAIGSGILNFEDGSGGVILEVGTDPRDRRSRITRFADTDKSSAIGKVTGTLYPN